MYFYYEPAEATKHFTKAKELSGLNVDLTGALGKRTRFQQKDLAQLVLQVQESDPSSPSTSTELEKSDRSSLPKDVSLDDDTVLDKVQFSDPGQQFTGGAISSVHQAMLLALCHQHKRSHEGHGDIVKEEILAFVNCVLSQPQNWAVQSTALLIRTQWQSDSVRRMDRSLAQLEELVNQFHRPSENPSCRVHLVYAVKLPPAWNIQKELATFLLKIGATKSALDIYLRLECWEEVINCYQELGRKEKAEQVIREQLAVKETPSLWCHLGDVLQDEEYYIKSWELSGGRFARAQKALGYHRLRKGEFEGCLECFEKTLQLNSLQIGVWFSYGCAAMAMKQYEKAAKGFRRCVTIDTDNLEAWNNLATSYIRTNELNRALKTLHEALKCDYENWRVWENLMVVATDCGEFGEVIQAHHRLLDIKDKYADAEVLGILTRAVTEDIKDASGNAASILRPKVLELFGRITSKVTNNADVWRYYSQLLMDVQEPSQTDTERALQYLQKSHRCLTQAVGWEKEVVKCQDVAEKSVVTAKSYLRVSEKVAESAPAIQMLSSARLMLKGVVTKIRQKHTDPVSQDLQPELQESCDKLEAELQQIVNKLEQLKGS